MDLADCRMLLEHAEWADALVWRAVLGLGVEDAELREKLHHLHLVQSAYLSFWRQEPVSAPDMASFPTLDSMADWARRYYRDLPSYLDTLAPEATTRDVQFPWSARLVERFGEARPATWAESVLQVAMHSAHHRGQLTRRLRELGGEPPLTDFVAWLWMGRPRPDWRLGQPGPGA